MKLKSISSDFFVSPQIEPGDMQAISDAGVRSVICNRPDCEGPGQPTFEEIDQAACALGLETHYLPVTGGRISDEDAGQFSELMNKVPKPALAYCRSGARSMTLWALSYDR